MEITQFSIDSNGTLLSLEGALGISGSHKLISDLWLDDSAAVPAKLSVKLDLADNDAGDPQRGIPPVELGVSGTLRFGSSFPEGVAGASCSIKKFVFNLEGEIAAVDATVTIPDQKLFGSMPMRGMKLSFSKEGIADLLITLKGQFDLPASFPQGLAGQTINVNEISVYSSGRIKRVSAGASGITTKLFGSDLQLENGSLSVDCDGTNEFIFSGGGTLVVPASMRAGLAGRRISAALSLSSLTGLKSLTASASPKISFPLFADINVGFTSLSADASGFSIAGDLTFPQSFPEGLKGLVVNVPKFAMSWSGEITAVEAGVAEVNMTFLGFPVNMKNLIIHKDKVTLSEATLTLPATLGSKKLGIRNAGFDYSGKFYGDFIVPDLSFDIAGFKLVLEGPGFDRVNNAIAFTSMRLQAPDWMKNARIGINGVSIGEKGFRFSGGAFQIPRFTVAGGLEFYLAANFGTAADGSYFIEGTGEAFIPGAGRLTATASFTDISRTYPIGLKRAYFQYQIYGMGLPIATSGLYITTLRGGLAFGPPDEIPSKVRYMFNDGTRIQVGVSLQDGTGGKVFTGSADLWIDINEWDWAFKGNVTVLSGLAKADLIAALTGKSGFYGNIRVEIVFARGEADIWIWKDGSRTKVAGSARVQFGLRKGSITTWSFKIWPFKRVTVYVPWGDLWLPGKFGAEFGEFNRYGSLIPGVKGYVDVPLWGQVGIFAPRSGSISFGNVSAYQLYIPGRGAYRGPGDTEGPVERVRDMDTKERVFQRDESFVFFVPGSGAAAPSYAATRAGDEGGAGEETQTMDAERVVFILAYPDGYPVITITSPSGAVYREGDPDVLVEHTEWGRAVAVLSGEAGEWNVSIDNVDESIPCGLQVYGKTAVPEAQLLTPEYAGEHTDTRYLIRGFAKISGEGPHSAEVYLSSSPDDFSGKLAGIADIDADGNFSFEVDTANLPDGEYYVFTSIMGDGDIAKKAYAPGSLSIHHEAALLPPDNLVIAEYGEDETDIRFDDPNGDRSSGCYLYIENGDRTEQKDIGVLDLDTVAGV